MKLHSHFIITDKNFAQSSPYRMWSIEFLSRVLLELLPAQFGKYPLTLDWSWIHCHKTSFLHSYSHWHYYCCCYYYYYYCCCYYYCCWYCCWPHFLVSQGMQEGGPRRALFRNIRWFLSSYHLEKWNILSIEHDIDHGIVQQGCQQPCQDH